jgi:hypothetical protein
LSLQQFGKSVVVLHFRRNEDTLLLRRQSQSVYERYYDRQQKGEGEFPVYVSRYMQKGHGLGNILGLLFRRILPVLKSFAPHALRAGANVLQDVSEGKSWKESAIKRIPEGLRSFSVREQSGSGKRRKRSASKDMFD